MKKKNNKKIKIFIIILFLSLEILSLLYFYINKNFNSKILFLVFSSFTLIFLTKNVIKQYEILKFIKETKLELEKIEWPKKKEIFYISIIIIFLTTIISIILWIIDNILFYIISKIICIRL
ncbi:preprotein translocase subunit SecE [Buchnera aphidicola (Ceratovacuna keduensis)]|uniref:preprotein translocase subunit SecE n=1 Tax=Buchnera aphidicola TaxID=9 RepID=UPI0031B8446E